MKHKSALSMLGAAMAGLIAATGVPRIFRPQASHYVGRRTPSKRGGNPPGSKLARLAFEGQLGVRHKGLRLPGTDGIRFAQVTK